MSKKIKLPLWLNWKGLKQLGHPYGRTHTQRLEDEDEYADRRFPKRTKPSTHRNSPPLWYTPDVLAYYKQHGLKVPEEIEYF